MYLPTLPMQNSMLITYSVGEEERGNLLLRLARLLGFCLAGNGSGIACD